MTVDAINNEEGRHYGRTWIVAFEVILDWPEHRTLEWADKWLHRLNEPDSLFYNNPPIYYIISLIIPDRLRQRLPSYEVEHLREQLLGAIQQNDSFCDRNPNFNWELARKRIEVILSEYDKYRPK